MTVNEDLSDLEACSQSAWTRQAWIRKLGWRGRLQGRCGAPWPDAVARGCGQGACRGLWP